MGDNTEPDKLSKLKHIVQFRWFIAVVIRVMGTRLTMPWADRSVKKISLGILNLIDTKTYKKMTKMPLIHHK
ncbi:hypothetical protein ACFL2O_00510 [Thermodesulfobacteriota bacterium]